MFRHLARLRRGDGITVRLENGTAARFAVTSVRTVAKADFPTEAVYGDVDRPELRLITCGGPLEGDEYRDNVIVFAALSATTPDPPLCRAVVPAARHPSRAVPRHRGRPDHGEH